jgi:hypothetical protein
MKLKVLSIINSFPIEYSFRKKTLENKNQFVAHIRAFDLNAINFSSIFL